MKKMLLIDGHNLLFRMFFGIPRSIRNNRNEEIKGVVGFIGSLRTLIKQFKPDHLVVVFDCETSTSNRIEIDENYKQNRIDYREVAEAENPFSQLPYIYQSLKFLEVPFFEATDAEADDYIASICHQYQNEYHCIIVSTDNDFFQIVNETTSVYHPHLKKLFTPEKVMEKYQVLPNQFIDYKIMVGDPSDNIKGIYRIGPKTAKKILNEGTINQILNNEIIIDPILAEKIISNKELIEKNRKLITMKRNLDFSNKLKISFKINEGDLRTTTFEILSRCGVA